MQRKCFASFLLQLAFPSKIPKELQVACLYRADDHNGTGLGSQDAAAGYRRTRQALYYLCKGSRFGMLRLSDVVHQWNGRFFIPSESSTRNDDREANFRSGFNPVPLLRMQSFACSSKNRAARQRANETLVITGVAQWTCAQDRAMHI